MLNNILAKIFHNILKVIFYLSKETHYSLQHFLTVLYLQPDVRNTLDIY